MDGLLQTWEIPQTGERTKYNAAIDGVFIGNGDYVNNDNPITGRPNAVNRLFFISDGEVNEGGNEIENDNDNKSDIQSNSVQVVPVAIGNAVDAQDFVDFFGTDIVPDTDAVHSANDFEDLAQPLIDTLVSVAVSVGHLLEHDGPGPDGFVDPVA